MAVQEYISRVVNGPPQIKIPFIVAMINDNGNLQNLPFPPQEGVETTDTIMGVELMVNPRSISNNMSKIINRTQTMTAFVEDHWGDELDTISFQGQTATFVVGGNDVYSIKNSAGYSPTKDFLQRAATYGSNKADLLYNFTGSPGNPLIGMGINDNEIGTTVTKRRKSVSYIQFKRFVDLIRANGCFYDSSGFVSRRLYIMLSYGSSAYKGFFDNIDITEEAQSPFKFIFTVTFKVEETIYSYVDKNISKNIVK